MSAAVAQGYCTKDKCTKFPVLVGETGSFLTDWNDKQWMQDFSSFIKAEVSSSWGC
jgi:hypothetical protein